MNYVMDNFRFDVTCRGDGPFRQAMALAFGEAKATAYVVMADKGLVFLSSPAISGIPSEPPGEPRIIVPFPFKMDAEGAADFALRWLKDAADYGRQPDHDGDNCRGWRLYNESWGHVGNHRSAIIAVLPAWAMIGK